MDHTRLTTTFAGIALALMLVSACREAEPTGQATAPQPAVRSEAALPSTRTPIPAEEASVTANASRHVRASDLDRFDYVMSKASITCANATRGLDCTMGNPDNGDMFDVRMYSGCGASGLFGGVTAEANLFDRYPPKSGAWPASLRKGQFVCILAEAGSPGEAYLYYVVETPTDSVADCAESSLCKDYGSRPVTWHVPRDGTGCRATGKGAFEGDCAMGWVNSENVEAFTMGLIPEPDYRQPQG
jgi:hypothetical protein